MNPTIHVRATHPVLGLEVTRTLEACPATLGRGRDATCPLEGDDAVSSIHASIDVRDGILLARDVGSTNGSFAAGCRLASDKWLRLGPSHEEHELRIGGWRVFLRAKLLPDTTVIDAEPIIGTVGDSEAFLTPFMVLVDRLSEPAHQARLANEAVDRTLAEVLSSVPDSDRASLARTIATHHRELLGRPLVAQHVAVKGAAPATPERAALAALNELSKAYVGAALETCDDIRAFRVRFGQSIDALVTGLAQAVSAVNGYKDVMRLDQAPRAERTRADLEKAIFDWRESSPGAGASTVRRTYHEVSVHQLASFNAELSGVRELLNEFAPESIEAETSAALARAGFWGRLLGELWRGPVRLAAYRRRHRDLATEENARFSLMFGPKFAEQYYRTVREAKSATVQGAPILPPKAADMQFEDPALPRGRPGPPPIPRLPPVQPLAERRNSHAGGTEPMAPVVEPRRHRK